MMKNWILVLVSLVAANVAVAANIPTCIGPQGPMQLMNQQVIQWKFSTKNQFLARAVVDGRVLQSYDDKNGHKHFLIQIGPRTNMDTLEVVYNVEFGALPPIQRGMSIIACGDYITSNAPSGPYPASPAGAIIHWVHANPSNHGHPSGYLVIDGVLYGNDHSASGFTHPRN